jgi:hypothetical protein
MSTNYAEEIARKGMAKRDGEKSSKETETRPSNEHVLDRHSKKGRPNVMDRRKKTGPKAGFFSNLKA